MALELSEGGQLTLLLLSTYVHQNSKQLQCKIHLKHEEDKECQICGDGGRLECG